MRTLVVLSLTASLATAAPFGFIDRFWSVLSAFWEDPPPVHQPQTKEGCGFDPNGLCHSSTQPHTDAGCGFDPNGQCHPGS